MWLAIDTTGDWCSVALGQPGQIEFVARPMQQGHSKHLLSAIHHLLAQQQTGLADLTGLAFGAGPGSFTGLRIACGVAQGMALGLGKPLVGISSTDAMAYANAGSNLAQVVALDARMGEIYGAIYDQLGTLVDGPFVCAPEAAALRIKAVLAGQRFVATGNGFTNAFAALHELSVAAQFIHNQAWPRADAVLAIAAMRFSASPDAALFDPAAASPLYVRNQVALNLLEQRQLKAQAA
jgi:tRNA threonylcarbamoyladenosine biosynthesis protein TsaB